MQERIQTGDFHDWKHRGAAAVEPVGSRSSLWPPPPYKGCMWGEMGFRMAVELTERMVFRGYGVGWRR